MNNEPLNIKKMVEDAQARVEEMNRTNGNGYKGDWKARHDPMETHMVRLMQPQTYTVKQCDHRLDPRDSEPRMRNCQHCWFAWFAFQNPGVIAAAKAAVDTMGKEGAVAQFGKKGGKFFMEFNKQMNDYLAQREREQAAEREAAKQEIAEIMQPKEVEANG